MSINFEDTSPNYMEDQKLLLCAKHAINTILQEEKLIWNLGLPLYYNKTTKAPINNINPALIKRKTTQLNLYKFCDNYPTRLATQSGQNLKNALTTLTAEDKCDMQKGMVPFEGLHFILRDLGYRTESASRLDTLAKFKEPNLLGAIFNLGGGHYTALSLFLKACKSWTRNATRRLTSVSYSYVDSYPKATVKCLTDASILTFLKTLPISAIIYVYYNPVSYDSISTLRARALQKSVGGKTRRVRR